MHVHVYCADGEAKVWLEPSVQLAHKYGLSQKQIREILEITEERQDEIISNWEDHFRS